MGEWGKSATDSLGMGWRRTILPCLAALHVRPSMRGDPLAALDRQVDSNVFRLVPVHALEHSDGPTGRQQHHGPVTTHLAPAPAPMQNRMDERNEFFAEGRIGALRIPDSRIVGGRRTKGRSGRFGRNRRGRAR